MKSLQLASGIAVIQERLKDIMPINLLGSGIIVPFTRPVRPISNKPVWAIKKNQSYFGMHVPRFDRPDTTQTWILVFENKRHAKSLANELIYFHRKHQEWPNRVFEEPLHDIHIDAKFSELKIGSIKPLKISQVDLNSLQQLADLEDVVIRKMVQNNLGDFSTLPFSMTTPRKIQNPCEVREAQIEHHHKAVQHLYHLLEKKAKKCQK